MKRIPADIPTGDPVLAAAMRRYHARYPMAAPMEKIARTDWLATAINRDKLGDVAKRVVDLECGHQTVTTNMNRAPCWKCLAMILNGEDYDLFRNPQGRDNG